MKTYILWLALMVMGAVLGVHAVEVEPVKHGNMIRGHVIEKDSEEHLPYATILIVETGEVFRNPYVCADAIGGNAQDIYRCLRGKTKTHKGFHYKEIKDGNVD